MKTTTTLKSILALTMGLTLMNCGSDGTKTTIPNNNTALLSPFRVLSSSPGFQQLNVTTTSKTFSVRMTEDVDDTTLGSDIQVVKGYDLNSTTGSCTGTAVATTAPVANGSLITIQATEDLGVNENYAIILYPTLTSKTGHTLLEAEQPFSCFYISFSTGAGGIYGNSKNGAPLVLSVDRNNSSTFSAIIKFDESLAYQPTIRVHYKYDLFSPIDEYPYAYPILIYDNSVWGITLAARPAVASTVTVYVEDFVDLDQGLHGTDPDTDGHPFTFYL